MGTWAVRIGPFDSFRVSARERFAVACRLLCLAISLFASTHRLLAWTPGTGSPEAVEGFAVDPTNRTDVLAFYNCVYTASEGYASNMGWTGSLSSGDPGATSAAFKDDVRRRINFYRALVGLPADITFDSAKSAKDQEAGLMFSANSALSHTPPTSWQYYTANGAEAAGSSNIALGTYGPGSVDAYIRDDGSNNTVAGHRRWLAYSRAQTMGTGDIPPTGSWWSANAVWVIGAFKAAPAPQFVAWPNRSYVPFALVPARWSLSYPGAGFANATVTMMQGAANVPVTIISNADNGYGDNTIVWTPSGLPSTISGDTTFNVSVSGITGAGVPASYSYAVTLFDPTVLNDSVTISGSSTPSSAGSEYAFNGIVQADAYQLVVSSASTAVWTEGAEDLPTPQILASTTGSYAFRQTSVKRTGSKSFHLSFPEFVDQRFQITRDIIPTITSQLRFYDLCRFATTTTTLSAEVSTDDGNTWTTVWSRSGVGLSSANWDAAFISRSVSLASYVGRIIRIRFALRYNGGSTVISTSSNDGFFIDDITITDAAQLTNTTATILPGTATTFTLDASTAGAPLVAGTSYYLRVRPNVGTRWFDFGPTTIVTPQTPTGYAAWVLNEYPSVTGGPSGDQDGDGLSNGFEYAFGSNPTSADAGWTVPQPIFSAGGLTVSFTQPAGVTGVTYAMQWSTDLVNWFQIPDTGSGGTHTFSASAPGGSCLFVRHQVTVAR